MCKMLASMNPGHGISVGFGCTPKLCAYLRSNFLMISGGNIVYENYNLWCRGDGTSGSSIYWGKEYSGIYRW